MAYVVHSMALWSYFSLTTKCIRMFEIDSSEQRQVPMEDGPLGQSTCSDNYSCRGGGSNYSKRQKEARHHRIETMNRFVPVVEGSLTNKKSIVVDRRLTISSYVSSKQRRKHHRRRMNVHQVFTRPL